jgi:MYXO-CTERM domain-containing protein
MQAVNGAAARWSRDGVSKGDFACTPLQVHATSTGLRDAAVANDGVNRVVFRRKRWCRDEADPNSKCYDSTIVAVTTVTATLDGVILDADIEVNAKNFSWADLMVTPESKGQDLQSTLTHELGHLLGLDHNCYNGAGTQGVDNMGKLVPLCSAANNVQRTAIMFPSTIDSTPIRRTLSGDEGSAVCAIYPVKGTIPKCEAPIFKPTPDGGADAMPQLDGGKGAGGDGGEQGGCSVGGHTSPSGLPGALAVAMGLFFARRRKR